MTIVTTEFKDLADTVARLYGCPDAPMVILEHPFLSLPHDEVRRIAAARAEEIFSHLARSPA